MCLKNVSKDLLELARMSILGEDYQELLEKILEECPKLKENGACFVTLTKNGKLRGCIGSIVAYQPLYLDIVKNAIHAAYHDPRFSSLRKEEITNIDIEITILKPQEEIDPASKEELFSAIQGKGVILEKNGHSAVFIPAVWEEINSPEEFLMSLAWKANLPTYEGAKFKTFGAYVIKDGKFIEI
jgi:AmmeMemoRadiSam system protein A